MFLTRRPNTNQWKFYPNNQAISFPVGPDCFVKRTHRDHPEEKAQTPPWTRAATGSLSEALEHCAQMIRHHPNNNSAFRISPHPSEQLPYFVPYAATDTQPIVFEDATKVVVLLMVRFGGKYLDLLGIDQNNLFVNWQQKTVANGTLVHSSDQVTVDQARNYHQISYSPTQDGDAYVALNAYNLIFPVDKYDDTVLVVYDADNCSRMYVVVTPPPPPGMFAMGVGVFRRREGVLSFERVTDLYCTSGTQNSTPSTTLSQYVRSQSSMVELRTPR